MKFFTVAAVAAFLGVAAASANADETVYQTHVVTITSCPPETPVCPGKTTYVPVTTDTPAPVPTSYSNSTIPCPTETPTVVVPVCPGEEICHPPVDTGVVVPPANTSVPVVPTSPPPFENSSNKIGASIVAIGGAAVLAMLM